MARRLLPALDRHDMAWYLLGLGLAGYVLVVILAATPWAFAPLAASAMLALLLAVIARPVATLAVVVVLLGAAGLPLGSQGFDVGIRVYFLDFLLVVLLGGLLLGTLFARDQWDHRWPLRGSYILVLAYLAFSLAHGMAAGHDPRDALGDFRRMAIYPLSVFFVAGAVRDRQGITLLLKGIAVASYGTVAIAAFRIAAGVGFAEQSLAGTTIRYLSYVEASTAGLGVLVFLGLARASQGNLRSGYLLAAVPPFIAVLVSNYRTAWLALMAGLIVGFGSLGWRTGIKWVLFGTLLLVPVGYLLIVYTSLGAKILERFSALNATTSGLWRYYSWIAALAAWFQHPLLGTGLGYAHHFEFFDILAGSYTSSTVSSIHNDPLWYLVNNGLMGLVAAATFFVPWVRRALLLARSGEPFCQLVGSTAVGGLTLMVIVSCLQPYFSTLATTAIAAVLIAAVLRTVPVTISASTT